MQVMNQMTLTDTHRIFHPYTTEYIFFSVPYCTFSKAGHRLFHEESLNSYKKVEITPCILSNNKGIKVEFNIYRNNKMLRNSWILISTLLDEYWVNEEIKYQRLSRIQWKWRPNIPKIMGHNDKRIVNKCLHKQTLETT